MATHGALYSRSWLASRPASLKTTPVATSTSSRSTNSTYRARLRRSRSATDGSAADTIPSRSADEVVGEEDAHPDAFAAGVVVVDAAVEDGVGLVVVAEVGALEHLDRPLVLLVLGDEGASAFEEDGQRFLDQDPGVHRAVIGLHDERVLARARSPRTRQRSCRRPPASPARRSPSPRLTANDGVTRSVAVSPVNRTYRSHSARTNRARCAAWTKKSVFALAREDHPGDRRLLPGLQRERRGMQDEASAVVALQGEVPLDAVRGEAPLGEHQSEMRRRPAHPQREDEARSATAEHVRVAALRVLIAAQVVPILERQRDADVPHRREDRRRPTFVMTIWVRTASPSRTVDTVAARSPAASFECRDDEAHVGVRIVRAQPVHLVRVAAEDQFHEDDCPGVPQRRC